MEIYRFPLLLLLLVFSTSRGTHSIRKFQKSVPVFQNLFLALSNSYGDASELKIPMDRFSLSYVNVPCLEIFMKRGKSNTILTSPNMDYRRENRNLYNFSILKMSPIGIPKVEYKDRHSSHSEWIDIQNRLYRDRIIFISKEIDHDFVNQIIAIMLYLDAEDSTKPINLYINSPGGSVMSGLALYDAMQHVKSKIVTVNVGLSASVASFILCSGTRNMRFALPNSRVMIHQPSGYFWGKAEDLKTEAMQILKMKEKLVEIYGKMTGKSREKIIKDIERDNFMSADDAKEYGIIDEIVRSQKEMTDVVNY